MSVIRFPGVQEYTHPHYLWNEQEYIIRLLTQNSIGASVIESGNTVTISTGASISKQIIAHGPVEFPVCEIQESFNTTATQWIYIRADGTGFFSSGIRPDYNQYLHGWYNNQGDRAIVFIDPDQPQGCRAMVMDSYNAHIQYDQRIPDTGGEIVFRHDSPGGWLTERLPKGKYRFELKAGRGGMGGHTPGYITTGPIDVGIGANGGVGAEGQTLIYKITSESEFSFDSLLGSDGANGDNGKITADANYTLGYFFGICGGGGSSGQDTVIKFSGTLSLTALGGAGGGGAGMVFTGRVPISTRGIAGAGGGGAGYGHANDGGIPQPNLLSIFTNGQGGGNPQGGRGGNAYGVGWPGGLGQSLSAGNRRNGGDTIGLNYNHNGQQLILAPSEGGKTGLSYSSGFLRVYKL